MLGVPEPTSQCSHSTGFFCPGSRLSFSVCLLSRFSLLSLCKKIGVNWIRILYGLF